MLLSNGSSMATMHCINCHSVVMYPDDDFCIVIEILVNNMKVSTILASVVSVAYHVHT